MKRLGVFAFFDPDGIVDKTDEYILKSLTEALDRIIVVVNGGINEAAYKILSQYTKEVICRPNVGYDGGAYQDIFLHYIVREELHAYDEILIMNNTFYGPFYPWNQVFERMESMKCDFWGLTKHLASYSLMFRKQMPEFIQSYFLVFRKRMFSDDAFWHFWEAMNPGDSFEEVVLNFEVALTVEFSNEGFAYNVYTDFYPHLGFLQQEKETVYTTFCYDLLKDCQFPVLKKRDGVSVFNPQTPLALDYIKDHYEYDMNMLWENALRTLKKARLFDELETFYKKYKKIYLYGCGVIAGEVEQYFCQKQWTVNGYLETVPHAKNKDGKPIIAWREFHLDEDTGVIVALCRKNTEEVREFLPESEAIMLLY